MFPNIFWAEASPVWALRLKSESAADSVVDGRLAQEVGPDCANPERRHNSTISARHFPNRTIFSRPCRGLLVVWLAQASITSYWTRSRSIC